MQPQPQLQSVAGPLRPLDVRAILSGSVDMRTYEHKHLLVFALMAEKGMKFNVSEFFQPDHGGNLAMLTSCVEWLDEHFGFELVNVFSRESSVATSGGIWYCHYAMLRRR
ncbi:hypothetical protein [Nocardia sp. NPDC051832]|uniref:hypothetical protein n=1 Tax=Nocardia sp. NPDC051832 TaxID=3155673 RepID=UPI00342D9AE5